MDKLRTNEVQKRLNHLVESAETTGYFDYRGRAFWGIVNNTDPGINGTQTREQRYGFLELGLQALDHLLEFYEGNDCEECNPRASILVVYQDAQKEYARLHRELGYSSKQGQSVGTKRPVHKSRNGF